jgi:phage FluMu gp28-like protein
MYWVTSAHQDGPTGAEAWKRQIENAMNGDAQKVYMDATGIGAPTAKDMRELYPSRFKGLTFSPEVKAEMVGILTRLIDKRQIRFCPGTEKLQRQLPTVQKGMTPSGKVTYVSDRRFKEGHSDQAWALLIACMSIRHSLPKGLGLEFTGKVKTPYDQPPKPKKTFKVRMRSQATRGI